MEVNTHYDVMIIGSGAAGAVLAARLTEDPTRSVLLLEAGPDYPVFETLPDDLKYGYGTPAGILTNSHDWGYVAEATPQAAPMLLPRGKVIGGSTTINAQVFLRGVPEDFDTWAAQGNDLWSFDQVLPYFRKLENDVDFGNDAVHGGDGPIKVSRPAANTWRPDQIAFYRACRDAGFPDCPDHNQPGATGVGPYPINNYQRIRSSTLLGYLNPARTRPNLTIQANCLVQQLLFEEQRAVGVLAEVAGQERRFAADEIIVSAGAIGSPHLLLRSGIGPAAQLRALDIPVLHDATGVGQNLRDHPAVNMTWPLQPDYVIDEQTHWHQVGLRHTATGSPWPNDMIYYLCALPTDRTLLLRPTVNLAVGAGELRLVSRDPRVQPQINFRYLAEAYDRQRLREGVRLALDLVEGGAFADIIQARSQPQPAALASDAALDQWLLTAACTAHHSSGTCKMGPTTDPLAVVDQTGKVYGVERLRVVDASIMPDCVRANTNATVIMMGERVAALLK